MFTALKITYSIFQIAAFVMALRYLKLYKHTPNNWWVWYLGFTLVVEAIGYTSGYIIGIKSWYIYNLYVVVSFIFYFAWYRKILESKGLASWCLVVFCVSIGFSMIFEDYFNEQWRIALTTGTILILICSTFYFLKLLNSKDVIGFRTNQSFWLSIGLLIFYMGYLPIELMRSLMTTSFVGYRIVVAVLIILMNSCFIYSFICLRKT